MVLALVLLQQAQEKESTMKRSLHFSPVLLVTMLVLGLLTPPSLRAASPTRRVLLLISDVGKGHASAAAAIEEQIRAKDPSVTVETRNIRDFEKGSEWAKNANVKIYWWIVKHYPRLFTRLYQAKMNKGMTIPNLVGMLNYDLDALRDTIRGGRFDVVVAAHYGAATALTALRERAELKDVRTGWLNTDYIVEYFPRFGVDKFFLGHEALTEAYREAGVAESRLKTTGIPVSEALAKPYDRESVRASLGLDGRKVVVMSAGAEGVADFEKMVTELSRSSEPVQIVAITARNEKARGRLEAMTLPENVKLVVEGFIPVEKVVDYVRSADLYVTKSGGLMPTEAFTAGVPTLLLDVYGGHESVNARLFQEQGMAEVVDETYEGFREKAERILSDESLRESMLEAQRRFQKSQNFGAIADFVLDPTDRHIAFGEPGGEAVGRAEATLATMKGHETDVEMLLAYGKGVNKATDNPFGHLGLRVNGEVYTANGRAKWGVDDVLVEKPSLADYLYGVTERIANQEFTDSYGETYGRSVLGLRVSGMTEAEKQAMVREYEAMQREWNRGTYRWHKTENNCADTVVRALEAAGIDLKAKGITTPLAVYERFLNAMKERFPGRLEVVLYERVPDAAHQYKVDSFPITFKTGLTGGRAKSQALHEGLVSKIVRLDPTTRTLSVVEKEKGLSRDALEKVEARRESLLATAEAIARQEERSAELHAEAKAQKARYERALAVMGRMDLSAAEREALDGGSRPASVTEREATVYRRAKAIAENFGKASRAYFAQYDEVARAKNELAMELVRNDMDGLLQMARQAEPAGSKKLAAVEKGYERLVETHELYHGRRHLEAVSHGDRFRLEAMRNFHVQAQALGEQFEALRNRPGWDQRLRESFARLLARLRSGIRTGLALVKASPAVGRFLTALAKPGAGRDLGKATKDAWVALGKGMNVDTQIEREGKIDPSRPVVYLLNHRHYVYDHVTAYEGIAQEKVTFVAQGTGYGLPETVQKRMNASEAFAPVGAGKINPVDRVVEALNGERSIILFPEGSTATGLGETRPLRPRFSESLLPDMLTRVEGGFQVVPVTISDPAIRYGETFDPGRHRQVKVTFHAPMTSEELARGAELGGGADLTAQRVRLDWHEKMEVPGEAMPGQMGVKELVEKMSRPLESFGTTADVVAKRGAEPVEILPRPTLATARVEAGGELFGGLELASADAVETGRVRGGTPLPLGADSVDLLSTRLMQEMRVLQVAGEAEGAEAAWELQRRIEATRAAGEPVYRSVVLAELARIPGLSGERVDMLMTPGGLSNAVEKAERRARSLRRVR